MKKLDKYEEALELITRCYEKSQIVEEVLDTQYWEIRELWSNVTDFIIRYDKNDVLNSDMNDVLKSLAGKRTILIQLLDEMSKDRPTLRHLREQYSKSS